MAKNTIIRSLTADEQQVLSLCGITQDEQLARIAPQALLKDIETATALFPESLDYEPEITRLEYICQQAASTLRLRTDDSATLWQGKMQRPTLGALAPLEEEPKARRYSAATGRMLVDDQHEVKIAKVLEERKRLDDPRGFSHAICCQHPVATYLGAWATVLLVAVVVVLLLAIAGLLIGIEYTGPVKPVIGILVGVVIFYAVTMASATCSTCRVGIFSFRRYPRHRKAHRFLLLGYTISTALVVLFTFRYRCPSCGTPQKLFGRRHRRRH